MMAAIVGGLFISIVLIVAKKFMSYQKITCLWVPFTYKKIPFIRPRFVWTNVN
jgi:hypothetical protein